jgi:hypothetical protein
MGMESRLQRQYISREAKKVGDLHLGYNRHTWAACGSEDVDVEVMEIWENALSESVEPQMEKKTA